jgi:3-polyprenyl-4-hydroxybenzoate decarboxylase
MTRILALWAVCGPVLTTVSSPRQPSSSHPRDQVLRGTLEGIRPGLLVEDAMCNYARSAIAWNVLDGLGVGGITDVWMSQVSNGTNIVVQIHKAYRGHAHQLAAALWGTSGIRVVLQACHGR